MGVIVEALGEPQALEEGAYERLRDGGYVHELVEEVSRLRPTVAPWPRWV